MFWPTNRHLIEHQAIYALDNVGRILFRAAISVQTEIHLRTEHHFEYDETAVKTMITMSASHRPGTTLQLVGGGVRRFYNLVTFALLGLPRLALAQQPEYQPEQHQYEEISTPGVVAGGLANSQKILIQDSVDDYVEDDVDVHVRSGRRAALSSSTVPSSRVSGDTYLVRVAEHPRISYPNLAEHPNTEIRVRYAYDPYAIGTSPPSSNASSDGGSGGNNAALIVYDDCPRHFLWLSDQAVEAELQYRIWNKQQNHRDHWSERVLIEKTYFTLFYGGTEGLASQYMDAVDDFQTDLEGWEVMNRSANHCDWEGIECNTVATTPVAVGAANGTTTPPGQIASFTINGFSLEGTLPSDLRHLSALEHIDLNGTSF